VKKLVVAAITFATTILPTIALACPTSAAATHDCCGSQLGQYASTFGIGLLFGVGSIAVESALRKKKK
jgi:hypothetical protein